MKKKDKKAQAQAQAQAQARIDQIDSELKELDRLEEADNWQFEYLDLRQNLINEKEKLTQELNGYNSLHGKKPLIKKTAKNAIHKEELESYKKELLGVEETLRTHSNKDKYGDLYKAAKNIVELVKAAKNSELFIQKYSAKSLADGLKALDRILKDPTQVSEEDIKKVEKLSNSVPDKKPMRREVKGLLIALAVVVVLAAVAAAIVFTGGLGLLGVPLLGKAVGLMIGGLAKVGVTSAAMHGAAHSVAALATGVPTTVGQATANVANAFTQAGNAAAQGYVNLVGGKFAAGVGVGAAAVTGIGLGAAALGKSKKVDVDAGQRKTITADSTNKVKVAAPEKVSTAKENKTEVFKNALDKLNNPATKTDASERVDASDTSNKPRR